MDENEILEAWGLTDDTAPEEDLGEGVEAPEDEDMDGEALQDDPEQDTDEPEEDDEESDLEEAGEDGDEADEDEDPFQSERDRISEQNRRDTQAALDAQVASLGLKDPYRNNAPITTNAELLQFQERSRMEKINRMATAAGMSEQEVRELIDQHPDVVEGKRYRQQLQAQAEAENRQRAERALNADLAEIERLMPGVGTKEGVTSHESWPEVRQLMAENPRMGLLKAFRAVNAERIAAGVAGKASAAAKRNAAGKGHLKKAAGRGEGQPEVPADVREIYRAFDPAMSDAEIRRAYAKDMKNKK